MKILAWNINGVKSALKVGFLDWLKKESPDILCLQEIRSIPKTQFENYFSYFNIKKKGYAGTAILTKIKPLEVTEEKFDSEGRLQLVKFQNFTLMNLYFPHASRDLSRLNFKIKFNSKILKYVQRLKEKENRIIIAGDFNVAHHKIDLANPKSNAGGACFTREERAFVDNLVSKGFIDTFREFNKESGNYTWWLRAFNCRQRNIGWRLDYIFVSRELRPALGDAFILKDVLGSDHVPVGVMLK